MQLTIETGIASQFLEPVEMPQQSPQGFVLSRPAWVSECPCEQTLFEVGSDRSYTMAKSGLSIIGRNEHSTVVVHNLLVSRCHAAILHHFSGRSYIVDMGSAHGTFIGKQAVRPLTPTMIPDGALIRFGIYGNQFVLKSHSPLKIVLAQDQVNPESFINTMVNRTLSFPGFTCDMEIHSTVDEIKCGKVGMSKHSSREDLHRTETLDCEGLMRLQKTLPNPLAAGLGQQEPTSPGTASISDASSESGSSCSGSIRRRDGTSPTSESAKRVRFTAPTFDVAATAASLSVQA
jgi:pSer/pThr/pTyr-binding forkhead associated (FHA) protein